LGVTLEATRKEVLLLQAQNPKPGEQKSLTDEEREHLLTVEYANIYAKPALVPQRLGKPAERSKVVAFGDLGQAKAQNAKRPVVEVALDENAFLRLVAAYRAKDNHGYQQLLHGDQTLFLVPDKTPLKVLAPVLMDEPGVKAATASGGMYVRVLAGTYEGYAGWMFRDAFLREGPDEGAFPLPEELSDITEL
jgi:hypothetical protein